MTIHDITRLIVLLTKMSCTQRDLCAAHFWMFGGRNGAGKNVHKNVRLDEQNGLRKVLRKAQRNHSRILQGAMV